MASRRLLVGRELPARAKLLRPKGTGTVARVGGRFIARAPRGEGRRSLGLFDTKEQAAQALGDVPDVAVPFAAWLAVVLDHRVHALRLRNEANDRNIARTHVERDALGAVLVSAMRTADVRGWLGRMLRKRVATPGHVKTRREDAPLSARTVSNALSLVRRALQHAVDLGALETNVARDVRIPRSARATERVEFEGVLDPDEQRRVLALLPVGTELGAMVRVALGLGLRRGELLSLRCSDVHAGDEEPFVVVRSGHKGPTKGGKPRRLPLFGVAFEALRNRVREQDSEESGGSRPEFEVRRVLVPVVCPERQPPSRGAVGHEQAVRRVVEVHGHDVVRGARGVSGQTKHEVIFAGGHGGKRSKVPAEDFRAVLAAAGISRRVRWHDLRHTCAMSLLLGWWGRRWSVAEVQGYLGHSSPMTTERYLHFRNEVLFLAVREMRDAKKTGQAEPFGRLLDETDGGPRGLSSHPGESNPKLP